MDVRAGLEEGKIGFVMKGDAARFKFALEYEHGGRKWAADFFADDEDDARAKISSMKASLVLLGEITHTIPWNPNG